MQRINHHDLIEISKQIQNPFEREISIFKIKEDLGNGFAIFYDLGNGIAISVRNFTPKKDFILVEESEIAGASLIFNFGSNIHFKYQDSNEHILKKEHFFIELASDKFHCEVPLKKDNSFVSVFVGIKADLFLKLANPIANIKEYMNIAIKQNYYILNDSKMDAQQLELFNDCKDKKNFEDVLKTIQLESQTTNILHYTIEKVIKSLNHSSTDYHNDRISSLERAKEIIMTEYSTKLSIRNIAYKSAINECYLKKDFKEYFGMTILEMLQKRRLEIAKNLLKENLSIKEVTLKIGYKNSSHFSKLFFDYFNITPTKYRKELNTFPIN